VAVLPDQRIGNGSDLLVSPFVSITAAHVISTYDVILGEVVADTFIVSSR